MLRISAGHAKLHIGYQTGHRRCSERITVNPEVIGSPVGLVPTNAPAVTDNRWREADFSGVMWATLHLLVSKVHSRIVYSVAASELLHRQDGAEAGLAVYDALIRLRSFGQRIRFDNCFHFFLGHEVERFVKIFGAVLLASDYAKASHE